MKPFAWSHSRLNAFETCPKRHYMIDLAKKYTDTQGPELIFGSRLHKALEERCRDGKPLPADLRNYEGIASKIIDLPGDKKYEQKLGLTKDFGATGFFGDGVWFRCMIDVLVLSERTAGVVDYKTGKVKPDPAQLQLNAMTIFAHYPEVDEVQTAYWWLTKGNKLSRFTYKRAQLPDLWIKFLPRVRAYEAAYAAQRFPANPSGLCRKWCPVTECDFHGG